MTANNVAPSCFERLFGGFSQAIASEEIPGATIIVRHRGHTHSWSDGFQDKVHERPITAETIFRLASLTKIVTSVLAMQLVEEGRLQLTDKLSRFFPRLGNLHVGVPKVDAAGRATLARESANRDITIHDLMRHTSGFTYGQFSDSLVQRAYQQAAMSCHDQSTDDILRKLEDLPLAYQPGSTFEYGMSTDVLGWVLETVAGRSLEDLVREKIAAPLGLTTMVFRPSPEQIARIAQPVVDRITGEYPVLGSRNFYEAGWTSGGHGLFTTAHDFARFGEALLNGGGLEGARIIGRKTLASMRSNHLPPNVKFGTSIEGLGALAPVPELGQGFGLGFVVRLEQGRNPLPGSVGDFGWAGLSGTYFWVDPTEDLCALLMMQAPLQRDFYRSMMRQWVYQAID